MIYAVAKRLLFRLDAEYAHEMVVERLEQLQRYPLLMSLLFGRAQAAPPLARKLFNLAFANPLGIAAGFDKNARLVDALAALGFGFIEVGTVTLRPQSGNPKPRMFRYPSCEALVNRLGFNNDGADAVARRLEKTWNRAAQRNTVLPPLFVNIGKNKDVEESKAIDAYRKAYRVLAPLADGVVVNVSSPNTPGLRDLQRSETLAGIVEALRDERAQIGSLRGSTSPIIVKIAPDLDDAQLDAIVEACRGAADAITATNTTTDRQRCPRATESGGLSGRPLFQPSTEVLRKLRARLGPDYPLIGVGGVFTTADAATKLNAGADLIQAYTGFVYGGPKFAHRIIEGLGKES